MSDSGGVPPGAHHPWHGDSGKRTIAFAGWAWAKGGLRSQFGTGRVGATQPMIFSADETTDIGYESGTTVTSDYTAHGSRFTGKIHWVQIDLGTDDHDHFIDPYERLGVAVARQ